MRKIGMIFALMISLQSQAHEGHDHGPSTVQPQKGGVVRALEEVILELVAEGKEIKIYAFDKEGKSVDLANYPVSLTATLPKKKAEPLKLEPKGDHWLATFDPKNTHRFDLQLAIKQGGHNDKVKWTLEPKRK